MKKQKPEPPALIDYVDTHFHLNHTLKKGLDRTEILDRAFAAGMKYALDIATGPEGFEDRTSVADRYPGLFLSIGYYPSRAEEELSDEIESTLRFQAGAHEKVVALGEIGLDYHWNYGSTERQQELFERQVRTANELGLPISIHCREAEEDLLATLRRVSPEQGGVLHCFSSDYEFAKECLDLGLKISFAGNVSYKKAENLQEAAGKIPKESLLLETDAPYLASVPMRGKTNRPDWVRYTHAVVAGIRGVSPQELADQVRENSIALFNLPE